MRSAEAARSRPRRTTHRVVVVLCVVALIDLELVRLQDGAQLLSCPLPLALQEVRRVVLVLEEVLLETQESCNAIMA